MKYIRLLFILYILMPSVLFAVAITPEFVVYQTVGKSTKLIGKRTSTLKKGDFLNAKDIVTISDGAKLNLICSNYKAFQLNEKGRYSVKNFSKRCIKGGGSFTAKYFEFVWAELTHPHSSPEVHPEKYMRTAGAVTRGQEKYTLRINVDTINICDGDFGIKFRLNKEPATVKFFSASNPFKIILSQKSTEYISFLEFSKSRQPAGMYFWYIDELPYKKSNLHVLNVIEEKQYHLTVDQILSKVIGINEADRASMAGFLLEQKHFFGEAQKYYKLALSLSPDSKVYQKFMVRFSESGSTL